MSCSWDYVTRSTANIAYNYCLLGFEFIQPVSMIAASYIGIVVSVRRQAGEMRDLQTGDQEGLTSAEDREQRKLQREKHKQERKLAKVRPPPSVKRGGILSIITLSILHFKFNKFCIV